MRIPRTADIGRRGNDEDGCCHQQCAVIAEQTQRAALFHSLILFDTCENRVHDRLGYHGLAETYDPT